MNIETLVAGLNHDARIVMRSPFDDSPLFDSFLAIGIALTFEQRLNRIHDSVMALQPQNNIRYTIGAEHALEASRIDTRTEVKIYDSAGLIGHIVKSKQGNQDLPRAMTLVEYWWYGGRENFEVQYRSHMGRIAQFDKQFRVAIGA